MRTSQTFQKRQKEMARKEKQNAKAQRRLQRKMEKQSPNGDPNLPTEDAAEPADSLDPAPPADVT